MSKTKTTPSQTTFSVQSKRDIFVSNMPKNYKVKVGFSFVLTGIKTVIILLAAYLSVWNIDYHWVNNAREAMTRREHLMHLGGDAVEGSEEIPDSVVVGGKEFEASKTTRQLWVQAACLPITTTIPLDTTSATRKARGSTW